MDIFYFIFYGSLNFRAFSLAASTAVWGGAFSLAALTVVARFPAASGRSATGLTPLVIWLSPLWLHATASCPFCGVHWAFRATCPRSSSTARWDVRDTA